MVRGQHANRRTEFILINVSGKSKVRITDGKEEYIVVLDKPRMGVYIPPMIWKDMYDFQRIRYFLCCVANIMMQMSISGTIERIFLK